MASTHRLLERQLKRYFGGQFDLPPEWRRFLGAVSDAYHDFDTSRELLERSLLLSSQELNQANGEMRAVFEAIPDLVFRLDADGRILDLKAGNGTDLLLPREAYRGKRFQGIPIWPLSDRFETALRQLQASRTRVSLEYALKLKEVECVYEARFVPVFEDEVIALIRNITERKRAEIALEAAHRQLLEASHKAGMSEVSITVLHNVGNALNSVNVSGSLLRDRVGRLQASNLTEVVGLVQEHAHELPQFLAKDEKGAKLVKFLTALAEHLTQEQRALVQEIEHLTANVERIKETVALQQSYARSFALREEVSLTQLCDDALRMTADSMARHRIRIVREYAPTPPLVVEKHRVLQILFSLLCNASRACQQSSQPDKEVTVALRATQHCVQVAVTDNGIGIPAKNLKRIFSQGFSGRAGNHTLDLHSSALTAKEMGGSLLAQSAGPNQGATFVLELPVVGPTAPQTRALPHQT